jgi:hypothetical protein
MAMDRDVPAAGVRNLGVEQPHVRAEYRPAYPVLPREQCRVGYRFSAASPEPFVKMMRPMNGVCIVRVDRDDHGLGVLRVFAEDLSVVFIHVSPLGQPSVAVSGS